MNKLTLCPSFDMCFCLGDPGGVHNVNKFKDVLRLCLQLNCRSTLWKASEMKPLCLGFLAFKKQSSVIARTMSCVNVLC